LPWKRLDDRQPNQLRHHRFELDFIANSTCSRTAELCLVNFCL